MTKDDLIDWALETDATFQDIQDHLEYWGFDDSYEATCAFIDEINEWQQIITESRYNA